MPDIPQATDKSTYRKTDVSDASTLSQQALDPKNLHVTTAGKQTATTDKVPQGTVTTDGSLLFAAFNKKLSDGGVIPDAAQPLSKSTNVALDALGNIVEVTLPNDQKRSFEYDRSGLNKITEPNGKVFEKVNDRWVESDGKPAPFQVAQVSSTGDLIFHANDQRVVTERHDGKTTALNTKDNSLVTYDESFRVTNVQYADGQSRHFTYDVNNGTLCTMTDKEGKPYSVKNGRWLAPDGSDTLISNAKVSSDGTYSYQQPDGKTVSITTAGNESHTNDDGSVVQVDGNGHPVQISYVDGKKAQFGYDDQGKLNKLVTPDGSTISLQNGQWLNTTNPYVASFQGVWGSTISDIRVQPDGSFWLKNGDNQFINSTADKQTSFDMKAIAQAARDLHEAKDSAFLWVFSTPETDKLWNIIEPMSSAQRQLLQEEYKKMYGHDLAGDIQEKLGGPEFARAEALLKRKDGVADNTGQIHQALAKLSDMGKPEDGWVNDDRVRAEKEIRDSINSLTADQLKAVEAKYQHDYGKDLIADLQNNGNLTDESKQALQIYFKGKDNRTDDDVLKLADMAISKVRPDIFDEVFRDASQSSRDRFTTNNGIKKIDDNFEGGDAQIAKDYLERGCVSIATIVNGDTHWYHTNKDDIERAVSNASDQDRKDFKRGEELDQSNHPAATRADGRALDFYRAVVNSLHGSGNDRETERWQAQLRNNESVIVGILDSRNDGGWFGLGCGTDKNRELSAIENMSQQDWQYLHDHPEELDKIDKALNHFDDSHHDLAMNMLHVKADSNDFASSQQTGNRPIEERLRDNSDNQSGRVDGLIGMSTAERQRYASNENGFGDSIDGLLNDEEGRLADHISKTIGGLNPTDKVLVDGLKNAEPIITFNDVEVAVQADPSLRDRINNPQTDCDRKLSAWFHGAMHSAIDKAGLGNQYYDTGERSSGQYEAYETAILQKGQISLDLKLQLIGDGQQKIDTILNASDPDKARLLDSSPDHETKKFQDVVFGAVKQDKEVLIYALTQKDANGGNGALTQADQFRLYVIDGGSSDNLKQVLSGMTPDERQNLANEYFTKYHSLITEDVIGKVPSDQHWRFRELLSPTDVGVRQIALDAQLNNDSHTSGLDQFLKDNWDYTRVSADSTQDNLTKFVSEHADELNNLSPEQRKQFDEAVANYQTAQKAYIDSKGQLAEAVIDATLTIAAVGGALFTGGTSLALLAGIAAGGAIYRTAMMAGIEGSDFDSSVGNILKQSFEGGTQAALSFIGPGELGALKVGEDIAAKTASQLVTGTTKTLFKEGSEDALRVGLADLSRQGAIIGDKKIAELAQQVAADGVDQNLAAAAIAKMIKAETITGVKNIVLNESEAYIRNLVAAQLGGQGKELLATGLGFERFDTLFDRMKGSATSTVAGVTLFHGMFRVLGAAGVHVKVALGKDKEGNFVAGEGTVIHHSDGTLAQVVGKDELVTLRPGDTISDSPIEHRNADGSRDLTIGNQTIKYDGTGHILEVSDTAKTRTTVEYGENPVTHELELDKVTAFKADGSVDPERTLTRENGVYFRELYGKRTAMATNVTVLQDGSVVLTGATPDTQIGKPRWTKSEQTLDTLTIHADNSQTSHYSNDTSMTVDAIGRTIALVSKFGVRSNFEYKGASFIDLARVTIGDNTYSLQNGAWVDHNGKQFADKITLSSGVVEITNLSDSLRNPNRPEEPIELLRMYSNGETEYVYKNLSAAPTDRGCSPESTDRRASVRRTHQDGRCC